MIRPGVAAKTPACAVVVLAAVLGIVGSCTSSGSPGSHAKEAGAAEDSGFPYGSQSDARMGSGGKDVGTDAQDPEVLRCEMEERNGLPGWKLNRDWSCGCRMFDPEPGTELPAWGTWEKCPSLGPRNVDCRVIVPPRDYAIAWLGQSADWDSSSGNMRLALLYVTPNLDYGTRSAVLVFDADGPTRNALMVDRRQSGGCRVDLRGMNQGKLAVRVTGKDPQAELDFSLQAVLGGDVDGPLANLVYQWDPPPPDGWTLSAFVSSDLLVIATPTFHRAAADWRTMQWREVWERDPEGLMVGGTVVWGKNVFVEAHGGGVGGIMSWDPEHGLRNMLRRYGDRLEGKSNFGTDGKDMVWTMGRRKEPQYKAAKYDKYYLMTAPFTTDPAVVEAQARVVREEHDGWFIPDAAYRVGCGYAAHITIRADLVVTRLSDGAEWVVERLPPPERDWWSFGQVLGVTCDEVFVPLSSREGYYLDTSTLSVARIRIDSLGEPSFPSQ